MPTFALAFLIGVVAGLRSVTPLAAVSWAARFGWLHLENTPLAFLAIPFVPYFVSTFALLELVNDKLPKTPSRKAPGPFAFRVLIGAAAGAALGMPGLALICGAAGAVGAVAGTLGGYEFRSRLVKATGGNDLPIALLEDAIAVCGAFWIVTRF